jgi:hypothetical protein
LPDATSSLYCVLDTHVELSVVPEASRAVRAVLRGFSCQDAVTPVARYALLRDDAGFYIESQGQRAVERLTLDQALTAIEWTLVSDALDRRPDCFHLHGAALLAPSGMASVLILGESGAGKTTLALGLMTRGFLPFADDVIVVDPEMMSVRTFPRAFHVDEQTWQLLSALGAPHDLEADPDASGYFVPARWANSSAPVRTILFPALRPEAEPAMTPMSMAATAAALLPFSATLSRSPSLALKTASSLTASAVGYELSVGNLDATISLVASAIG